MAFCRVTIKADRRAIRKIVNFVLIIVLMNRIGISLRPHATATNAQCNLRFFRRQRFAAFYDLAFRCELVWFAAEN